MLQSFALIEFVFDAKEELRQKLREELLVTFYSSVRAKAEEAK